MSHSPPSNLAAMMQDLAVFRANWLIDAGDGPVVLDRAMDPWQRADYEALDPGWRVITGQARPSGQLMRAYLERPRGHSKTTDIAVQIAAALISSPTQITGIAAAADRDQGKLVRDSLARQVAANPWPAEWLQVDAFKISNVKTRSSLEIISSDAASSYGQTPDFVICDELTHWGDRGEELWTSLFSAAAKRGERCLLLIISNAGSGEGTSWQWKVRETARTSDDWLFRRVDGPKASWISVAQLSAQERMLPKSAFRRLWLNEWTSGAADGIPHEWIYGAVTRHDCPLQPPRGSIVLAGLDMGVANDCAALAFVALVPRLKKIVTLGCFKWSPRDYEGEIRLEDVERTITNMATAYGGIHSLLADPWQAVSTVQRLRERRILAKLIWPGNANASATALAIFHGFRDGIFELHDDGRGRDLVNDLLGFSIVQRPGALDSSFKLVPPKRTGAGHSDLGVAWCYAAAQAAIWLREDEGRQLMQAIADEEQQKKEQSTWGKPIDQVDSPTPNWANEFPNTRRLAEERRRKYGGM